MNSKLNYNVDTAEQEKFVTPPVNICETKDSIVVEAEMPGVDKSRLEVSVEGNELVIVGRKKKDPEEGDALWQEIPRFDFRRTFTLGDHINHSDIHATFQSGVLSLKLGKAEDVKPRKIEVQFQ